MKGVKLVTNCVAIGLIYVFTCTFCRLHDEIMAVGGARLKPQQAMVDRLVKEIDDANDIITKATVGIKTNER